MTVLVPGKYDVALNDVPFMLDDTAEHPGLVHQSLTAQREQAAGAAVSIGEATVNPEGFWRRSRDSWHHGAGQTYGDREESDPLRFFQSRGVDVFSTRHQLTLCHALELAFALSGSNNGGFLNVGGTIYFIDGGNVTLKFVGMPLTVPWVPMSVTGTPGNVYAVCAIGSTVFIGTNSGIYTASVGGVPASSYVTGGAVLVWAAKGRLMVAGAAGTFYNVTAAGALPSPLITFPTGYGAVGVVGAGNYIYVAVASASAPSLVYKTTIKPDGTALDVPTVAWESLPGETFTTSGNPLFEAAGKMYVHTNLGVRQCEIDANGNLVAGSVILSDFQNVACWCAEDRFVWFNHSDPFPDQFNTTGKLDPATEILPVTPAFATDVEPLDGLSVKSLASLSGRRIVGTNNHVYIESATDYVDSGYMDSGLVALDLADAKTPVSVDMEAAYPADTSITEGISVDRGGSYTTAATFDSGATAEQAVTGIAASRNFALRTTLIASADNASTPTLYRHTLKVEPHVAQGNYIVARLILAENTDDKIGSTEPRNPATLRAGIEALQMSRAVVVFQEGAVSYNVTVRDVQWENDAPTENASDGAWNGVATVRLKVISAA